MNERDEQRSEFLGKTVEEATAAAAASLGVAPERLEVEVLEEPGSLASLLGRRTRIAARVKPGLADNGFDPVAALARIAAAILPEARVAATEEEERLVLEVIGDGSGIFIGRKGATLDALQFVLNRMAQKQGWAGKSLVVEAERYRQRHTEALQEKARRAAEQVLEDGRFRTTEPLDAADRRVIHFTLKTIPGVTTRSLGNGEFKRVRIGLEGREEEDRERGDRDRHRRRNRFSEE